MTISDRIFDLLEIKNISQREFSEKTGIAPSTISDWKRKGTNPVSDKVLVISKVLGISPEELLSGSEARGSRSNEPNVVVIEKNTVEGELLDNYLKLNTQGKLLAQGYIRALSEANGNK